MNRSSYHRRRLVAALAIVVAIASPASGRERKHNRHPRVVARAMPSSTPADAQPSQPPLDDLYRRRSYGVGGPVFGADTALAGSCADLRFAHPASWGRGYGIYGNGLGTQFGR